MTWVKICGITNLEDALSAVDAGADALGFVFYENSHRRVDLETARHIVEQLPDKLEKVGVFVDSGHEQLAEIVTQVGLTTVQCRLRSEKKTALSGKARFPSGIKVLMTLSATRLIENERRLQELTADFLRLADSPKRAVGYDRFLLDSTTTEQLGGTGRTFEWQRIASLVQVMNKSVKVVAAGGLTPENVGRAMRVL